jgi:tetratricopeptide (TPR) repeat protein
MATQIRIRLLCAAWLLLPSTAAIAETPAESALIAARARLERAGGDAARAGAWLALAAAHTKRARESGDAANYERALEALAKASASGADAGEARKLEAWVRLGLHEFAAAEALAREQTAAVADDPDAWALLGDALMELGRLEEAGDAYQRMMNLRPGPGAYVRAAYWRERAGDLAGALELQQLALSATGQREHEERAWILVHSAALHEGLGNPERAEAALLEALALFPEYHYALEGLAELYVKQGRAALARDFARRAIASAPHPERRLVLADALRALGDEAAAREQEQRFEREALANQEQSDNENVFLVDYYLDRRPDPPRALAIALREAKRRPDPPTLERLARARARVKEPAKP